MLRRIRLAPVVRAALLAAGALMLSAAFGLHPEAIGAGGFSSHRGMSSAHLDEAAHVCPACLTHAAALAAPPADPLAADLDGTRVPRLPGNAGASRYAVLDVSGRSPPVGA